MQLLQVNCMELLLFCNVKHSSALVNLRVGPIGLLLDRIPVCSVPRATVRTLTLKKPKNLIFVLKTLGFYQP